MGTSQHISPLQFRSISFSQGSRGIASPRPILMLISWLWVPLEQASSINSIPNPRDSKPVVIISQKTFIMVSFGILTILKCTVQQHLVHSKCYATFWFQDIFYSKKQSLPIPSSSQPPGKHNTASRRLSPAQDRQNPLGRRRNFLQVLRFMSGSRFHLPSFAGPGHHLMSELLV